MRGQTAPHTECRWLPTWDRRKPSRPRSVRCRRRTARHRRNPALTGHALGGPAGPPAPVVRHLSRPGPGPASGRASGCPCCLRRWRRLLPGLGRGAFVVAAHQPLLCGTTARTPAGCQEQRRELARSPRRQSPGGDPRHPGPARGSDLKQADLDQAISTRRTTWLGSTEGRFSWSCSFGLWPAEGRPSRCSSARSLPSGRSPSPAAPS